MNGEENLEKLLSCLAPKLSHEEYVFHSFKGSVYGDHADLEPIACFMEGEGLSLVIPKHRADAMSLTYDAVFKCITLRVHSSLEAVGLTAKFSTKLTEHGISANVVAGFYHDHIFVQSRCADKAVAALNELSSY